MTKKFTRDDFNFHLPDNLVAQYPEKKRDESRLFLLNKKTCSYEHKKFYELDEILNPDDLLIFNNAKVIHARIFFTRSSGGKIEIILTQKKSHKNWLVISNKTKKLRTGEIIYSVQNPSVTLKIISRINDYLEVVSNIELTDEILTSIGEMPLPPYIKRDFAEIDKSRYQTVYASNSGAAASPTAGLHFTQALIHKLKEKGINLEFLTLYVSWGTFQPVRENDLSLHNMHTENYHLPEITAEKINAARKKGQRIIAVGTTALRVLEATFHDGENISGYGETDIFIYPPCKIKSINGLITNFHTPFSTLLMLVASFAGYDTIMDSYREAVKMNYRFFSYGDAMFIS